MAGPFHGCIIAGPSYSWLDMVIAMAGYGHSNGWIKHGMAVFGQLSMAVRLAYLVGPGCAVLAMLYLFDICDIPLLVLYG